MKNAIQAIGFNSVVELNPYETYREEDFIVLALPFLGEHGELPIDGKAVFHVTTDSSKVALAADANGLDPQVFADSAAAGETDALVIGIEPAGARAGWLYGPILGKGSSSLRRAGVPLAGANADQVLALAGALRARMVLIYGTGAPGMHHILGRSAKNASRAYEELNRIRTLPGAAHIDVQVLDQPGRRIKFGGSS
jgi:hypothetical protein